eukprot:4606196-Prymnesium_polylepis.1
MVASEVPFARRRCEVEPQIPVARRRFRDGLWRARAPAPPRPPPLALWNVSQVAWRTGASAGVSPEW